MKHPAIVILLALAAVTILVIGYDAFMQFAILNRPWNGIVDVIIISMFVLFTAGIVRYHDK